MHQLQIEMMRGIEDGFNEQVEFWLNYRDGSRLSAITTDVVIKKNKLVYWTGDERNGLKYKIELTIENTSPLKKSL